MTTAPDYITAADVLAMAACVLPALAACGAILWSLYRGPRR